MSVSYGGLDVSRRRFLQAGTATAGVLALGGVTVLTGCEPPPPGTNPARNPLKLPPSVVANGATITAEETVVDIGGGTTTTALTYNGSFPGPTIHAQSGATASFVLDNALDEISTIHSHGLIAPTGADGQPIDPVAPGSTFTYTFPVVQRAGFSFYHPHPFLLTGHQVALGLAGGFIVHDDEEDALDLVNVLRDVPLVLRDALFDRDGNMDYKGTSSGFMGDTPMVNGTLAPSLGVDDALYRFRILNGSNARVYRLSLSNGADLVLVGNDGGLLPAVASAATIIAAPGERFDVLVDFNGMAIGDRVRLTDATTGWDFIEFEVTRLTNDPHAMPTGALSTIDPLGPPVRSRVFDFQGMSKINGVTCDLDRIDFDVPFGETELWRFTTGGNAPHPVHIHGVPFQVQSRTGGRNQLYPWEAGWKDTVLLEDSETVDVLINFDVYRGQYLIHCHQLEHEDNGMMLQFNVV